MLLAVDVVRSRYRDVAEKKRRNKSLPKTLLCNMMECLNQLIYGKDKMLSSSTHADSILPTGERDEEKTKYTHKEKRLT